MTALTAIYEVPLEGAGGHHDRPTAPIATVWLWTVERVLGLGALAVREADWAAVHRLASHRVPGVDGRRRRTWIRHAIIMTSRAELLQAQQGSRPTQLSLLSLARDVVRHLEYLRPNREAEDEHILTSLVQFDFLACLLALYGDIDFYPNFARFRTERTAPAAQAVLHDAGIRQALHLDDDQRLAVALNGVDQAAQREAFAYDGWDGYPDDVTRFIADHLPPADRSR